MPIRETLTAPATTAHRSLFMMLLLLIAFFSLSLSVNSANAQFARTGELPAMDGATRRAVVDSLTAAIDSIYVLGEPAKRITAGLRQKLADGDYDGFEDPAEFARQLETDAQAINHDGHFGIRAMPALDPAVAEAGRTEDPADAERRSRDDRARNYGFKKAEIMPGGVGYLRFDRFSRGQEAFEAGTAAMNFVANGNAVILDLRYNGGGAGSMIRFLAGYLFEENTHLINWDIRAENETVQSYSADYVPGKRIIEQPVYILTSGRTFSAAEEFTFDMRHLERATLVGETTGGGGHTVTMEIFDFDGFRMGIRLPYGRAYNPKNNEGWEGVGVIPHIEVPAEEALDTAYLDALNTLIEAEEDEMYKPRLRWPLADIESRINPPAELSRREMKEYVGSYGPRRIYLEDGSLFYEREGRPPIKLEVMGTDLFRVGDLEYFRLSFERNGKDKVVKVIGNCDNGEQDDNARD